jgi:hypothetical protein
LGVGWPNERDEKERVDKDSHPPVGSNVEERPFEGRVTRTICGNGL